MAKFIEKNYLSIGYTLAIFLIILSIFHILVISGVLPANLVWGGQELPAAQIQILEIIALLITILFLIITLSSINLINNKLINKITRPMLIVITGFFSLNIVTNLLSNNNLEKMIFVPLSVVMAICSFLLFNKTPKANQSDLQL